MTADAQPRQISEKELNELLHELAKLSRNENSVCLIYSAGGHPRSFYHNLARIDGVTLRYVGSILPVFFRWLSFIPSHAGVVEVTAPASIRRAVSAIAEASMMQVSITNKTTADAIVEAAAARVRLTELRDIALQDHQAFVYQLQPDDQKSETGMLDWLYFGSSVSDEIKARLKGPE